VSEASGGKKRASRTVVRFGDLPPVWSEVAEKEILGAIISGYEEVKADALARLDREDFFNPTHAVLFQVFQDMDKAGEAIDITTVQTWTEKRQLLDALGGVAGLAEFFSNAGTPILTSESHIKTVAEMAALRRLRDACSRIVADSVERQHEPESVLSEAESLIMRSSQVRGSGNFKPISSYLGEAITLIQQAAQRKGMVGMPCGLKAIDEMTGGFQPGQMIVVAARPGVGKTALALCLARSLAKVRFDEEGTPQRPGYRSAFLSLEMLGADLSMRLLAMEAQISYKRLREGQLSTREHDSLAVAGQTIAEMPLFIHDDPSTNVNQLRAAIRRAVQKDKVEVVFVDYLQLLESGIKKPESRQAEVAEISRKLKVLALELGITIIALSQLNRESEKTTSGEPFLHHLRESGAIEQDADIIFMLWQNKEDGRTRTKIEKQRNGASGPVKIQFVPEYMSFRDEAPPQQETRRDLV
jgi:replicative DNA helicase